MDMINEIRALQKAEISRKVEQRLKEFESFRDKSNEQWFSELCFCILTANSKARTALEIQQQLGAEGFCKADPEDVIEILKSDLPSPKGLGLRRIFETDF